MATEKNVPLCTECALPLAGGIDTYGGYGDSLCFSCYMYGSEKASEIIAMELALAAADDEEDDARCQAERCASAVRDLETKIQKLKGGTP